MSVINREDTIDYLMINMNWHDEDGYPVEDADEKRAIITDLINGVPDADDGWIPVEKRLPEEHEWLGTKKFGTTISDEVYVTFENEKGERFCKYMTFQNGELSRYDKAFMEAWYKGSKPIAWMPFPKPYEPKEDK